MFRFEWSDDLSVGNDRIDTQHKGLIDSVNGLLSACREGVGVGEIPETIRFLDEHVRQHFRDEEELQRSIGYPGYDKHKAEHREFTKVFGELKSDMEKRGPSLALAIKTSGYVLAWLKEHLNGTDRELGRYIAMNTGKIMKE